jgi:formylglycine-generating enzyme required for sulfatase activity
MGSFHDSDAPRRLVYVDEFYICRYPVTNAEYLTFVEATTYMPPQHWQGGLYKAWEANHPVVYVNWHDATAYCRWAEGRLPSEAEWERTARGTDERQYPWGNTFDPRRCNTREGGKKAITSVGRYSPAGDSPYGAGDMAGQVWEWVLDWYAPTYGGAAPARNPLGPQTGQLKVIRGGSFTNNASLVTSYTRDRALPNVCAVNYGFRVRLSVEVLERNDNSDNSAPEQSVS